MTNCNYRLPHPTEKWAKDINELPCKECNHFRDNIWIQIDEIPIWVTTDDQNVEMQKILTESKAGFKCTYNGIKSTNPNELRDGVCKYKH